LKRNRSPSSSGAAPHTIKPAEGPGERPWRRNDPPGFHQGLSMGMRGNKGAA